jgi:hypothetical protein
VAAADDLSQHGRRVADTRADNEGVVALAGVKGGEQAGDRLEAEHAGTGDLVTAGLVGVVDELVAGHRPEGVQHRGSERSLKSVFQPIDHVGPERLVIHYRNWGRERLNPTASPHRDEPHRGDRFGLVVAIGPNCEAFEFLLARPEGADNNAIARGLLDDRRRGVGGRTGEIARVEGSFLGPPLPAVTDPDGDIVASRSSRSRAASPSSVSYSTL